MIFCVSPPLRAPTKLRFFFPSKCLLDSTAVPYPSGAFLSEHHVFFNSEALVRTALGGPILGPYSGPAFGIKSLITGLCVIRVLLPKAGPEIGPMMGSTSGSKKQVHTLQRCRPYPHPVIPERFFLASPTRTRGAERPIHLSTYRARLSQPSLNVFLTVTCDATDMDRTPTCPSTPVPLLRTGRAFPRSYLRSALTADCSEAAPNPRDT